LERVFSLNELDRHVCLWINGWPEWLSPFLTFFSIAMQYVVVKLFFAGLLIGMIARGGRARAAALLGFAAFLIANGLTDLLKHQFPMHRPFQHEALGSLIITRVGTAPSMGTASAHAANMAALATVTVLLLGRWGWPWIVIALVTGLSRVYVGAHFPSQVLMGWICGTAAGLICVGTYRLATRGYEPKSETDHAQE
jgi:undecaprenyl-diphosphatase